MRKRTSKWNNRLLAGLLAFLMAVSLMPMPAYAAEEAVTSELAEEEEAATSELAEEEEAATSELAEEEEAATSELAEEAEVPPENGALLTLEHVELKTVHGDGSQGEALALELDQETGAFCGKLANYTDLPEYNDVDLAVTLVGLPEGTSAWLTTESGEEIAEFINGSAQTTGGAVAKKGSYTFGISLRDGEKTENYELKLEKAIGMKWNKLVFGGTPEFSSDVYYYGAPEGTLFQLDDQGQRTGETGLSEDCFNYEVYVGIQTESVKPAGATAVNIFKDSFSYTSVSTSVYVDDELLFASPTSMAAALKWYQIEGIKLLKDRTELRIEFKCSAKSVISTRITFVLSQMDAETLIPMLEELKVEELVWPDDCGAIVKLYQSFMKLSEEEKAKIPQLLREKIQSAYELMADDRVPSKLEIVKPASKLVYAAGQSFDPSGMELCAIYEDGTTRTITEAFEIEPEGALTDEKEVTIVYNTVSVTQPIKIITLNLEGEGTEEKPYQLTNTEDLQELNDFVVSGQSTEGKYFEMTADITLPEDWKPMGVTIDGGLDIKQGRNLYAFSGTIDGKNHTLTVLEGGLPLLGYVKGAEVRNLNIYGKKIAGYGLVNNLEGVGLSGSSIVIDHVTLKSGSSTLKSGLLGANVTTNPFAGCSAGFEATVRNCTIEEGVVIGYDRDQMYIGSIAGRMQGTVENCVSYATVYGTSYVGGIIGTRDNAMGTCQVTECEFNGVVEASGEHAGGILGGAYSNSTAPNGGRITVTDCSSSGRIVGKDKVGGIMGADTYVLQSWGQNTFKMNRFTGTVEATGGTYVGGVIGYLGSLNKYDGFAANYYASTCGAKRGIGFVKYVDTSCETHETESGAIYFDTSVALPGISGIPKANHNRTDDPLGADAVMLAYSDDATDPIPVELSISGEYKTSYLVGEALDLSGMTLTVAYHTGESKEISADEVEIQNYDPDKRGAQTVSLVYGKVSAMFEVMVLKPATGSIHVSVSILGDAKHGGDSAEVHTLADKNLTTWMEKKTIEADVNATVIDVIEKAIEGEGITLKNPSGNYIESVTKGSVTLSEIDNGPNSGWMYTRNGMHSRLGVSEQYLEEGDVIVLHYTDDYTKESAIGGEDDIAILGRLNKLLEELPETEALSLADEAAVTEAMNLYNSLSEEGKAAISQENLDKLNGAVQRIAELRKEAQAAFEEAYQTTGSSLAGLLKGNEGFGVEWPVIGLARAGRSADFDGAAYYENVVNTVEANGSGKLSSTKSTENARTVLALTAIGKDVTNVAGYNLLEPLSDLTYLKKQGINGPIWALIAFDSHGYGIPTAKEGPQATRENIIAEILSAQLADGGWDLSNKKADPDMTAMALQALAPYYSSNTEVKESIEKALACLSAIQNQDGSYSSWETTNSESCAQVIVALTALGIDPAADARFVKNGNSVVDALLGFYVSGGGFKHTVDGAANGMATEQGYYALAAYSRMMAGQTRLYDMSDIMITENPAGTPSQPTSPEKPSQPTEPSQPTGPEKPGQPTEPEKPGTSSEPQSPDDSDGSGSNEGSNTSSPGENQNQGSQDNPANTQTGVRRPAGGTKTLAVNNAAPKTVLPETDPVEEEKLEGEETVVTDLQSDQIPLAEGGKGAAQTEAADTDAATAGTNVQVAQMAHGAYALWIIVAAAAVAVLVAVLVLKKKQQDKNA